MGILDTNISKISFKIDFLNFQRFFLIYILSISLSYLIFNFTYNNFFLDLIEKNYVFLLDFTNVLKSSMYYKKFLAEIDFSNQEIFSLNLNEILLRQTILNIIFFFLSFVLGFILAKNRTKEINLFIPLFYSFLFLSLYLFILFIDIKIININFIEYVDGKLFEEFILKINYLEIFFLGINIFISYYLSQTYKIKQNKRIEIENYS